MANGDVAGGADAATVVTVRTVINGSPTELAVEPFDLLLDVVRERLDLTGTKRSCDLQVCGACTVLLDGAAVSACTTLAMELDGSELTTIEGLSDGGSLHPVQRAFVEHGATQCGFCTPGMIMSVCALASERPDADPAEVREYLSGTICRCTGYAKILEAANDVLGRTADNRAEPSE
jgi:carbon-monoxide dehydrogenase small subunit